MSWKCFRCGHDVFITGENLASEVGIADATEDDDAIVETYTCPNCGANYEVDYPIKK